MTFICIMECGKKIKNMFKSFGPKWQRNEVLFPTCLSEIMSIKITCFESEKYILLSKSEIEAFLALLKKGCFKNMLKCATSFEVDIVHSTGTSRYYIHANAIGPLPGGLKQVVFTPIWEGFTAFLNKIHDIKSK